MKKGFLALLLIPTFAAVVAAQTPAGDAAAGKTLWDGATTSCKN